MIQHPSSLAASDPLQRAVDSGLTRVAVPVRQGGTGGDLGELARGFAALRTRDPEGARSLRQQRLSIELLLHSRNAGLRELLLPDFLSGTRAATVALDAPPLAARDLGSAWLLEGEIADMHNLAWEGFSLIARAQLDGDEPAWVVLRSEEDGLDLIGLQADHTAAAALRLRNVYFRVDEWLGGPDLTQRIQPLLDALPLPAH